MEKLLTRPYERADAPQVAALVNLVDQHAGGHPGFTPERLAEWFALFVADPASDTRLLFAGADLVAMASVTTPTGDETRLSLQGGVHPAWRGRGLGRDLLAWQLARAEQIHRAVPGAPSWQALTGVVVDDRATIRLLERAGFTPIRYWFEMVAPAVPVAGPAAAPVPEPPDRLRLVGYADTYEVRVHAAHMEAFADHWGFIPRDLPAWRRRTVASSEFVPGYSLVALDGDQVAGYLLGYRDVSPQRLYVGQVGVRPGWRRQGLASALLARVRQVAVEAGLSQVGLAVDADSPTGAVGVYQRAGFVTEGRTATYQRTIGPPD